MITVRPITDLRGAPLCRSCGKEVATVVVVLDQPRVIRRSWSICEQCRRELRSCGGDNAVTAA